MTDKSSAWDASGSSAAGDGGVLRRTKSRLDDVYATIFAVQVGRCSPYELTSPFPANTPDFSFPSCRGLAGRRAGSTLLFIPFSTCSRRDGPREHGLRFHLSSPGGEEPPFPAPADVPLHHCTLVCLAHRPKGQRLLAVALPRPAPERRRLQWLVLADPGAHVSPSSPYSLPSLGPTPAPISCPLAWPGVRPLFRSGAPCSVYRSRVPWGISLAVLPQVCERRVHPADRPAVAAHRLELQAEQVDEQVGDPDHPSGGRHLPPGVLPVGHQLLPLDARRRLVSDPARERLFHLATMVLRLGVPLFSPSCPGGASCCPSTWRWRALS